MIFILKFKIFQQYFRTNFQNDIPDNEKTILNFDNTIHEMEDRINSWLKEHSFTVTSSHMKIIQLSSSLSVITYNILYETKNYDA